MAIAAAGKIVIEQNYLSGTSDVQRRLYYLANYLLVKGKRTYLFYFADSTLEWYPEWEIDLGAPVAAPSNVDALAWQGVTAETSPKAACWSTPHLGRLAHAGRAMQQIDPQGGGAVSADGAVTATVATTSVTSFSLAPGSGAVLLK